jgi:hypothetical protein
MNATVVDDGPAGRVVRRVKQEQAEAAVLVERGCGRVERRSIDQRNVADSARMLALPPKVAVPLTRRA